MIDYRVTEFSTASAGHGERTESWGDHVKIEQGAMSFAFTKGRAFRGKSVIQAAHRCKLAEFASSGIHYIRSAKDARNYSDRSARLVLPRSGRIALSQGRDTVSVTRESLGIVSMDRAMSLAHTGEASALLLTVPDGEVTRRLVDSAPLLMDRRQPLVAMLANQIDQMAAFRDQMSPFEFVRASEGAFHLLESALDEKAAAYLSDLAETAGWARTLIATHSDDRCLDPQRLADALGCSVRRLYTALDKIEDTTPGALIRTTRVKRAADRLADPYFRTIDEVWTSTGFGSASAFRDAFIQHYNMTPSQMRETAATGDGKIA